MRFGANNLLCADIKVDGCMLAAYIDTGSSHAFIDGHAYDKLCAASSQIKSVRLSKAEFESVECSNGTAQAVRGWFNARMQLGEGLLDGKLYVVEKQPILF